MIKLEKRFVTFFFLCLLLSIQCTGYIIDEKLLKKGGSINLGENWVKKIGGKLCEEI